ncbi:YitT family protein [Faecalicatena contorta]|uniref:YitT family protein n=1 Tax=Faecalicatena contorta TaxID=39482 RepID=UPI001F1599EB|nr:YitT family protein [Faecalicatena contorta]MCF2681843.1 YitT family protein [Faecalicatena contorta]
MKNWKKSIFTIAGVLLGNLLLAFTVAAFVVPYGIVMGGATGISLTISHYVPVSLSTIIFVVNIILFLVGAFVLGKTFAFTTIISTFVYPIFLSVIQAIPGIDSLTDNVMLASVYGGILLGAGIGVIVRVGASTGGTDILALVFNKWFHIPIAILLYVVDFLVLGSQILFSDSEQILYGILCLVLSTVVLNRVMLMGQSQIQLFIVSEKYQEIKGRVLKEIDAGVTMVQIETGYGQKQQQGVLCVIPNRKLYSVKEMVQTIDPKAFITISQINEVRGRGFSMERIRYEEEQELKEEN